MKIPRYPEVRRLELCDKPTFDGLFAQAQPIVSEFTFANLYLFRGAHDYRVSRVGDAIAVAGTGYAGEEYFLPPWGDGSEAALLRLLEEGLEIYGVDVNLRRSLPDLPLDLFEDRDSFDYVYLRSDLANLPGSRFHKKANRIRYFISRHDYQTVTFDDRYTGGCLHLLDEWYRVRAQEGGGSLAAEVEACREAIILAGTLGLQGVVILVEGEVKAFVLGEMLNRQISVCHFEKADPFMEGLPQLADREFCRLLYNDCIYVNREQDLGDPGLRMAKLSYHPAWMVEKCRVKKRR